MTDYSVARTNMVDGQIHTNGVVDTHILSVFESIPREDFIPDHLKSVAYYDEDLFISPKRFLMEPFIQARMIQEAQLQEGDIVLDIGCATGYSSAILSKFVSTVVSVENDSTLLEKAQKVWNKHEICNILSSHMELEKGASDNAPYDHIFINGAIKDVPKALLDQLGVGGNLLTIQKNSDKEVGNVVKITRLGEEEFSKLILFQASTPYLAGFEPQEEFVF